MDMIEKDFDKDILIHYINKNILSNDNKVCLMRLYKSYILVDALKKGKLGENSLSKYEDKIYTIDGKIIPENRRIELEMSKINKKILENNNNVIYESELLEEIEEIKELLKDLSSEDKVLLEYLKKKMSIVQAKLGMNNTFLESAYTAFLEKYRNICINNINEKEQENVGNEFILKLKEFNDNPKKK